MVGMKPLQWKRCLSFQRNKKNFAAKVVVADEFIDPNDTALQKTVKAKAVRGDYRDNRKVR